MQCEMYQLCPDEVEEVRFGIFQLCSQAKIQSGSIVKLYFVTKENGNFHRVWRGVEGCNEATSPLKAFDLVVIFVDE